MFDKILIANRGEIACRIIATARTLGIRTVAVYSDADAGAKHVAMADESLCIGPPPAVESYLNADRIVDAARATGAQAIHPGYGFLSENPAFVEAVEAAGLTFVGPPADAIRAMGLKDAAKSLMERAGVPVVPGYHGAAQDPEVLAQEAARIGYPVLIKARAGGGGKGMRRVDAPAAFEDALRSAQHEAEASFGDPRCLIEKYVAGPRHIEVQVMADAHGNAVHLFERDCSLQRRHQKVIEEAPAPGMTDEMRAAMGAAAVAAAKAVDYRGAGTVEFIVDGSDGLCPDRFWFMEMNTRLQVEHPVTEAITGLDLVELQLRVAAGEPLPFGQDDLAMTGHAFEARLYAEDAAKGFLPAVGTLTALDLPGEAAFRRAPVRIDSGVRPGDEITPHYDPMIAKVIVHGPDRATALARLAAVLADSRIAGCTTNLGFLHRLCRDPGFAAGTVDTGLIDRAGPALTVPRGLDDATLALAAVAACGLLRRPVGADPFASLRGWRLWGRAADRVALDGTGETVERTVIADGKDRFMVEGGSAPVSLAVLEAEADGAVVAAVDGVSRRAFVAVHDRTVTLIQGGEPAVFRILDPLDVAAHGEAEHDAVPSPMPGVVASVSVRPGDAVEKGQALVAVEAMKMLHALMAPRDGVVAEVLADPGDQVDEGTVLVRLETAED